jgi:SPP1 gp7 family putative phage head morphogenesis protein
MRRARKKQVELKPVMVDPKAIAEIARRLKRAFVRELYAPLFKIMNEPIRSAENAKLTALTKALWSGRLSYSRGTFQGKLSADISRELKSIGATWDESKGAFVLPRSKAPDEIKYVSSRANELLKEKQRKIDTVLSQNIPAKIANMFDAEGIFAKELRKVDTDIRKSVKRITVTPKLSKDQEERISQNWRNNMDLYIKKFSKKEIRELRGEVMKSVFAGARREEISDAIRKSYGVSERKAKFLAHQETRLLLAEYKESKYERAGVTKYRWSCVAGSPAHPVRPSHKVLDRKIFEYKNPPITTAKGQPARRNNPGQDYNCRCHDIPIVEID